MGSFVPEGLESALKVIAVLACIGAIAALGAVGYGVYWMVQHVAFI